MTIRSILEEFKPRHLLASRLGISAAYACTIARGQPIGGTETLARISARLGLKDEEIGASVREMFPEHFASEAVADECRRSDDDAADAHLQGAEGAHHG